MIHHEYLSGIGKPLDLLLSPLITTTETTETITTNNNNNNNADRQTEYSDRTTQLLQAMRLEYVLGIVSISLALLSIMLALKYGMLQEHS